MILRPGQRVAMLPAGGLQAVSGRATLHQAGGGWWDDNGAISGCLAAWQAKGAADQASSYADLSGNGNNLSAGSAPSWDAGAGWTFNGSSHYLVSTVIPAANYSWLLRFSSAATNLGYVFGSSNATWPNARFSFRYSTAGNQYENGGTNTAGSIYTGGVAGATTVGYLNGSADTGTLNAWSGTTTQPIYIGCRNSAGSAAGFCSVVVVAIAIYSATLSGADVATISTAMAAL